MNKALILTSILLNIVCIGNANLTLGFDANEYRMCLKILAQQTDTNYAKIPMTPPEDCKLIYHSPDLGLDNQWNLWVKEDSTVIVSIRGSVGRTASWLENFYSGMLPASGTLKQPNKSDFNFTLSSRKDAAVHAGWLIGTAYLAPDITRELKDIQDQGYRNFIITGHSQGGVLSMLMTSYLHYQDAWFEGSTWKNYASAPPKPGNQAFAYDFDFITRGGKAFRVVNSQDWVPESPVSVQTLDDMNETSPLRNADQLFDEIGFVKRVFIKRLYYGLNNKLRNARDKLIKNVGKRVFRYIKQELPGIPEPKLIQSQFFVTCGVPIILAKAVGYDEYLSTLNRDGAFTHHMFKTYWYLINAHYPDQTN